MPRDEKAWEEMGRRNAEGGDVFRAYLERLMEEKGVSGIEELHERFLATGWRIPIPGRHADKPVKLEEFKLHCARAYPSPEHPLTYNSFFRGLWEALRLTEEEFRELLYVYMWGKLPGSKP